jgi:hypothetical protein
VELELPVEHVDPEEVLRLLLGREVLWRSLQVLDVEG